MRWRFVGVGLRRKKLAPAIVWIAPDAFALSAKGMLYGIRFHGCSSAVAGRISFGVYALPRWPVRIELSDSEFSDPRDPRLNLEISMSGWYITSCVGTPHGEAPPDAGAECGVPRWR